ncbi:ADP-heptose:LPS heptosyltransferase [Hyella patelloides LEGE 07179]|uniref:ADP-heptose:LPS heptosyltransferase n=1 Tax=Hyella patelloides LEGE 07179 TaxID=945734 RepID=A0A563VW00_9CYAN|nr:glycosyltransferase family 9 protein [Hyella patelloides]VEP15590.1 ADP-heptose:LPS heptosyltransferase [Hyella patelloides LEGE 07179]
MRILALVPGGIGNQIYFFPTLETLNSKYPQSKIDVLVEPRAKKAYRVCKYVSEVLLFDYQDRSSMADYLNLLGVIRDREYEAVISYNAPWAVESLLWLNGIPVRIGEQKNNSWIFSKSVPLKREQYEPQTYHDILQGLGIEADCPPLKINVPQKDIDWAESRQKLLDLKSGYILLHGVEETYPITSWQKIVTDIQAKQPEIPVVLLQTQEEDFWVAAMMTANSQLKVIASSDVGKIAAIIAGANLLVTSDRNSLALAVAVETYTIALIDSADTSTQLLPQDDNYVGVCSSSKQIADIAPETVLGKIWGN